MPAPPAEQVYRAKPFPYDPPPEAVPGPYEVARPEPEPMAHAPQGDRGEGHDGPDGFEEADAHDDTHDDEAHDDEAPGRSTRQGRRTRGRRARRGRGKRVLILAACLGTVLLGLTVTEIGTPVLTWTEWTPSSPDAEVAGQAEDATKTPDGESPGHPGTASGGPAPGPESEDAASPSGEPSPSGSGEPSPEPTEVSGSVSPDPADPTSTGHPEESSAPTPPDRGGHGGRGGHDDHDRPDDDYDCWLVFCS